MTDLPVTNVTSRHCASHVRPRVTVTNVTPPYRGVTVVTLGKCAVEQWLREQGIRSVPSQFQRLILWMLRAVTFNLFSANSEGDQVGQV